MNKTLKSTKNLSSKFGLSEEIIDLSYSLVVHKMFRYIYDQLFPVLATILSKKKSGHSEKLENTASRSMKI